MGTAPFASLRGISKSYGAVRALHHVDLDIGLGEIVAIVGDNGAGKSTLVKVLSGAVAPDSGSITIDDVARSSLIPTEARELGIETIYQDLALLPNLDVVSNLFLGREIERRGFWRPFGVLARAKMKQIAIEQLADLKIGLAKVAGTEVAVLSGGQRQSVAIARAVCWASKLLIMDEPTAALGVAQSKAVLELIERVREKGTSVIIVSHILPHVIAVADRVAVMRHGQKVADLPSAEATQDALVELIVGAKRDALIGGAG